MATLGKALAGERTSAPPALERALKYSEDVSEPLFALRHIFVRTLVVGRSDTSSTSSGVCEISLEPGQCPEYDALSERLEIYLVEYQETVEQERCKLTAAISSQVPPATLTRLLRRLSRAQCKGDTWADLPVEFKPFVPIEYELIKQTKSIVRFRVPALSSISNRVAQTRSELEYTAFLFLSRASSLFLSAYKTFLGFCAAVATLDALAALAEATHPGSAPPNCTFCRPVFTAPATHVSDALGAPKLALQGLWNPQLLLSKTKCRVSIQPNDLILGAHPGRASSATMLLTGANTGGKSTLLRATCLAVIMAQIGCYVPCSSATLAPVDRVFTRMGAYDRLAAGESTFCVEMTETAAVLRHAQPSSLVVLDELGRGTSTQDGHAIATAVVDWLTRQTRCRVLCATHYHEMCLDPGLQDGGVVLAHMSSHVGGTNYGLVPTYCLLPGPAPEGSCGVAVAAVAGIPKGVVSAAKRESAKSGGQGRGITGSSGPSRESASALCRDVVDTLRGILNAYKNMCGSGAISLRTNVRDVQVRVLCALNGENSRSVSDNYLEGSP